MECKSHQVQPTEPQDSHLNACPSHHTEFVYEVINLMIVLYDGNTYMSRDNMFQKICSC